MGNETRQSKWLRWLEDAARYREDHGDLLIQRDYVTPQGRKLGRWIERQRAAYHGRGSCRLDDKRIRSLEALGMIWELEARPGWDVWIQLCRRYARKTGNLDLRKKEGFEGYALGEWICMQRRRRRRGELSEEQIRLLDTLGMVWERNTKYPWMEWYALAKEPGQVRRSADLSRILHAGREETRLLAVRPAHPLPGQGRAHPAQAAQSPSDPTAGEDRHRLESGSARRGSGTAEDRPLISRTAAGP